MQHLKYQADLLEDQYIQIQVGIKQDMKSADIDFVISQNLNSEFPF